MLDLREEALIEAERRYETGVNRPVMQSNAFTEGALWAQHKLCERMPKPSWTRSTTSRRRP